MINLLFVDDDEVYWDLFQAAVAKLDEELRPVMTRLEDGAELMPYLARCSDLEGPEWPDLVLLDQRMPRMDGTQLLSLLREDRLTRTLPVCLMSSSEQPHLVAQAYALGANFYITKPLAYSELCTKVRILVEFFTTVVAQPARHGLGQGISQSPQ